jgi:hypothetical protein
MVLAGQDEIRSPPELGQEWISGISPASRVIPGEVDHDIRMAAPLQVGIALVRPFP